jgi:hypothetical protein
MTAPDARTDLAGAVNWLISRVEMIDLRIVEPETISLDEIARDQGVSRRTLYSQPWRLPAFGKLAVSTKPRKFRISDYRAWMSRSIESHQDDWDAMSVRERGRL